MSAVPPALTAEEWQAYHDHHAHLDAVHGDARTSLPYYHASRHGIAAANLYGLPEGFTHDDVEEVNIAARREDGPAADRLWGLADRIAALLPPRP